MNNFHPSVTAELYSCYMMDYLETHPESVNFNCPFAYCFPPDAGLEKILSCIEKLKASHPVLDCVLTKENGVRHLCHAPEKALPVSLEAAEERDIHKILQDSVEPFHPDAGLVRLKLISTEEHIWLFIDIYHALTDGTGLFNLFRDFSALWNNEEIPYDNIFALREEREALSVEEDRLYYKERYDGCFPETVPTPDADTNGAAEFLKIPVSRDAAFSNSVFLTAALSAMSEYNSCKDVFATWTFHSRFTAKEKNSCGLFIRDLPVCIHCDGQPPAELYKDVKEQIKSGISHFSYQYQMLDYSDRPVLYTVFQKGIYDLPVIGDKGCSLQRIPANRNEPAEDALVIEAVDCVEGRFIMLKYDSGMYRAESMQKFGNLIKEKIESFRNGPGC